MFVKRGFARYDTQKYQKAAPKGRDGYTAAKLVFVHVLLL
jgi:hypothetical protein